MHSYIDFLLNVILFLMHNFLYKCIVFIVIIQGYKQKKTRKIIKTSPKL